MDQEQKVATRALAIQGSLKLFLQHAAFTNDSSDQTVIGAKKFPWHKDYIRQFYDDYTANRWLCVEKSRQMSISWFFAASFAWEILSIPNSKGFVFAQDEDKAIEFIQRVKYVIDNIPEDMWPSSMRGDMKVTQLEITIPGMNSGIKAMTSSPNKGHGYTPSFVFFDEFGMHPEAEASYRAIAGAIIGKTNRNYIVSTPPVLVGETDHIFFQIADDRLDGSKQGILDYTSSDYDEFKVIKGYHTKPNPLNGFRYIRLHYSADPERDEAWAAELKSKQTPDSWAANFELIRKNYGGLPVYKETFTPDRNILKAVRSACRKSGPLVLGWDFGGNHSVILGQKQGSEIVLLHEWANRGFGTRQLSKDIVADIKRLYGPGYQLIDIIDPSAEFHGKEGEQVSLEMILKEEARRQGRSPSTVKLASTNKTLPRIDAVERFLCGLDGLTLVLNPHLTMSIEGFINGYVWPEKQNQSQSAPKPLKNGYSHIHDCIQYLSLYFQGILRISGRPQAKIVPGKAYF
jgi:hypothetical protein